MPTGYVDAVDDPDLGSRVSRYFRANPQPRDVAPRTHAGIRREKGRAP